MKNVVLSLVLLFLCSICAHPTMYKYNLNKKLEPDLVPVSSTVIPLPVYQIGYGINLPPTSKNDKIKKPEGPISLITIHNKNKKAAIEEKPKHSQISTIKEISKKDFEH